MIILVVIPILVNFLPTLLVPLDRAVILKHVNPNLLARFVAIQSMNVTCLNIARELTNSVPMMCIRSMEHHVKWAKHFVLVVRVGHIPTSANSYGGHPAKNLIISATSKTEKEPDMEIAATTGSTNRTLNVRIQMSDAVSVEGNILLREGEGAGKIFSAIILYYLCL